LTFEINIVLNKEKKHCLVDLGEKGGIEMAAEEIKVYSTPT